jgi:hypothetical protein
MSGRCPSPALVRPSFGSSARASPLLLRMALIANSQASGTCGYLAEDLRLLLDDLELLILGAFLPPGRGAGSGFARGGSGGGVTAARSRVLSRAHSWRNEAVACAKGVRSDGCRGAGPPRTATGARSKESEAEVGRGNQRSLKGYRPPGQFCRQDQLRCSGFRTGISES